MKKLTILLFSAFLLIPSTVIGADYYAKINVYYNVPSDTAFWVAFPASYSGGANETANNATLTNWISFNFTSATDTWTQPQTTGASADVQSGSDTPILFVGNVGNVNSIIAVNGTVPAGFAMCMNSTCFSGDSCGSTTTPCTAMGGASFTNMATALTVGSRVNISAYGNATSTGGQSTGDIFIRSAVA